MIKKYIVYRGFALVACGTVTAVLLLISVLGGLSRSLALYGLAVAVFLIIILCGADYFGFARRIKKLNEICASVGADMPELPLAENEAERLYGEIINQLYLDRRRERDRLNLQLAAQQEYYTVWLHQAKTPIAAMWLALEPSAKNAPELMRNELFSLERYVEMALQYSKLQAISGDLLLRDCALDPLISEAVKKYSSVFISKKLSVDFKRTGLVVVSDEKWLSFILCQLLSNASKYTQRGAIKIYAEGSRLAVEDSGIGVQSDDIERIFECGYTGYNGRSDKHASGIGLFLARKAAAALHVSVDCEPLRKSGARFFIELKSIIKADNITKL